VRGDEQVLICPTCQGRHSWKADLDRCGRCGSVRLVRRLGEVECRDCGFVGVPERAADANAGAGAGAAVGAGVGGIGEASGLSEEVARALDRVLGRGPARR
jgi:ribosomal protein L40E